MTRSLVDKVMWVGRATVFAVGLVAIFALLLGVAYVAFGTLSGNSGQRDVIPQQVGIDAGASQTLALEALARRRVPTQGYAQVLPSCTSATPSVCQFEDSRAVKGVVRVVPSNLQRDPNLPPNAPDPKSLYCFDLSFIPHIAVASPFTSNNATVATAARDDVPAPCPAPYEDAAARTFAANTSFDNDQVGFAIMFR